MLFNSGSASPAKPGRAAKSQDALSIFMFSSTGSSPDIKALNANFYFQNELQFLEHFQRGNCHCSARSAWQWVWFLITASTHQGLHEGLHLKRPLGSWVFIPMRCLNNFKKKFHHHPYEVKNEGKKIKNIYFWMNNILKKHYTIRNVILLMWGFSCLRFLVSANLSIPKNTSASITSGNLSGQNCHQKWQNYTARYLFIKLCEKFLRYMWILDLFASYLIQNWKLLTLPGRKKSLCLAGNSPPFSCILNFVSRYHLD